jgi:cyanophycinase
MPRGWQVGLFGVLLSLLAGKLPAEGHLVLFGGGERRPELWKRFLERSTQRPGSIVILPTASELEDTGLVYFRELSNLAEGRSIEVVPVRNREGAFRLEWVESVRQAAGIFFTGGDQNRLVAAIRDTPLFAAVVEAWKAGACVGGTSAGLAAMSHPMLTGEGDPSRWIQGSVQVAEGLGLVQGVILDQHFLARQRLPRLVVAVLEHAVRLGIGVDEETAMDWRPDGIFEVLGQRQVVVVDARRATLDHSSRAGALLLAGRGITVSVLVPGESFDPGLGPLRAPSTLSRGWGVEKP